VLSVSLCGQIRRLSTGVLNRQFNYEIFEKKLQIFIFFDLYAMSSTVFEHDFRK